MYLEWLGCPLLIHRRCLDPMFSLSNEVAYNNRMFKQTAEPKSNVLLLMNKSVWIDKSFGTIHTFQGKEANGVILVLGCDEKSGLGATQWASKNRIYLMLQ